MLRNDSTRFVVIKVIFQLTRILGARTVIQDCSQNSLHSCKLSIIGESIQSVQDCRSNNSQPSIGSENSANLDSTVGIEAAARI